MWKAGGLLLFLTLALTDGRMEERYADKKSPSDLRKDIFKNYDSLVLPVSGPEESVPVTIGFVPIYIREMDEEREILIIDGWIQMQWADKTLVWNPSAYNNIKTLNIPSDNLWIPDISTYTSSPDSKMIPIVMTNVILSYNGTILWVPPMTVSSRCPMNLHRFPNDIQTCEVKLGSWTYGSHSIDLQVLSNEVDIDVFQDNNPEWSMKQATVHRESKIYPCCPDEAYPSVSYNFTLKRKCSGNMYIADTVSVFAVVIGLMMFFLPADSAQKVVIGTLAEVLLGVVALYLGTVVKSPGAKFIAGERVYGYMALVAAFILAEVIILNIARVSGSCRPPKWLLYLSKSFCQPFGVCSSRDSNDAKDISSSKEEWYIVGAALDRIFLIAAVGVSVFIYKLR